VTQTVHNVVKLYEIDMGLILYQLCVYRLVEWKRIRRLETMLSYGRKSLKMLISMWN